MMMMWICHIWIFVAGLVYSQTRSCDVGWFGSSCQYKCRCTSICERDGSCTPGSQCQTGWFGPACQYVDLARNVPLTLLPVGMRTQVITDGNDRTCNADTISRTLILTWNENYLFTWLRVYANNIGSLQNLTVQFSHDSGMTNLNVTCVKIAAFNSSYTDILCDLNVPVNHVFLTGEAVTSLCSLYISGGRNVALHQQTTQSSTYEENSVYYGSEKAVDGNTNSDFMFLSCTATSASSLPYWSVTLSRPVTVYRYVLYNRNTLQTRLQGFKLKSFDDRDVQNYNYTDPGRIYGVYIVLPATPVMTVSRVNIEGTSSGKILTLCEAEIYGETMCVDGRHGPDCEHKCNCADIHEMCFVSTGGCISGCAPGYHGEDCKQICPEGKYGQDCQFNCSEFCSVRDNNRTCENINGTCLLGCQDGYYGQTCNSVCPKGTFGKDCESNCSQFCETDNSSTPICDNINGTCLQGCQDGYISPWCNQSCPSGKYGSGCAFSCSQFCATDNNGISNCHPTNGSCVKQCFPGYDGPKCDTYCTAGTFGKNCRYNCSEFCVLNNKSIPECDHVSGMCECQHGYYTQWCILPCPIGTFGQGCHSKCSQFCKLNNNNNIPDCDHITGTCSCQTGYDTPWCNSTCPTGTFGQDCRSKCSPNCVQSNNETCHHIDGSCQCQNGYASPGCSQVYMGSSLLFRVIVGAVVAAISAVVIIAVVASILCHCKKVRLNKPRGEGKRSDLSAISKSSHDKFPGTELIELNDMGKSQTISRSKRTLNVAVNDYDAETYYSVLPERSSTIIKLNDLDSFLATRSKSFFQEQFSKISDNSVATTNTAQRSDNNDSSNKDVCAYDHSHVYLMSSGKCKQDDYINVFPIQDYSGKDNIIASEDPTERSLKDFVCLLWEQKTEVVVMLSRLMEDGKDKCEKYWSEDGGMTIGEITVKLVTSQVLADYTIRKLQLRKTGERSLMLTHFHFTAWPDLDVHLSPWALVDFEQRVSSYPTTKPIVVHCSDGVGRTGTFISLLNVLRQADDKGHIDIFTTVQKLRNNGMNMLHTWSQYEFLHRAAQVAVLCMGTSVASSDIQYRLNYLEKVSDSGVTNMEKEFKTICKLSHVSDDYEDKDESSEGAGNVYENSENIQNGINEPRNSKQKTVYTPTLQRETDDLGEYINAVFVPSFSKQNQHFLTQLPLPTTVIDFWRLVTQYNVSLIVAFEDDLQSTDPTVGEYLPTCDKEVITHSLFEVESETVFKSKLWLQSKVTITTKTDYNKTKTASGSAALKGKQVLTHLKCKITDLDPENFLALITKMRSLSPGDESRIIYTCRHGADYSGLACVLSLLLDRMDSDGCASVPLVVGSIKAIRPQVVSTLAEYQLLYQILCLYADGSHEYSILDHTEANLT